MATSTGTSICPVTLVIVRIMSRIRSIAYRYPIVSNGRFAALNTTVAITTAVPGTPAVPKLPSTDAINTTMYCSGVNGTPVYCAMNTAHNAG
ncbi:hypothetical protein D9M71_773360 [compost metagenome]